MITLLIPGFSFGAAFYTKQISYLTNMKLDVKVYIPHKGDEHLGVDDILSRYPGPLNLVGQSMGARLCFLTAAKAPERIKKICVFQAGPCGPAQQPHMKAVLDFVEKVSHANTAQLLNTYRDDLCKGTCQNGPHIEQSEKTLKKCMAQVNDDIWQSQARAMMKQPDISSILKAVQAPTLVVNSEQDPYYTLEDAQYLTQHLPHAAMTMLPGVGHGAMVQTPENVNMLLRLWLHNAVSI